MPMRRLTLALARRRSAWLALLLAVSAAHWWVAGQLPDSRFGEGAAADDAPEAIEVAFVRELAPALPPVHAAVAPPPPAPAKRVVAVPERPASAVLAPEAPASEPVSLLSDVASTGDAAASAPIAPVAAAASAPIPPLVAASAPPAPSASSPPLPPAVAVAAASAPAAFDWPPSTRLSYDLVGYYRGPAYGNAKVEWLREGPRYQVRLEVRIPPIGGRRMLSDGLLGPNGLSPRRYDEETEVALRETTRQTVLFEADRIVLANKKVNDPLPGVQDTASQFVQMTWLFLTKPELLQVGRSVDFPLALPRRVGMWTYDVAEQVDLQLPFGEVKAFHLVPRPGNRRPKEWTLEVWIAPSLQYLPAKIVMRLDAETHAELSLKSLPLQAAGPGSPPATASPPRP
ncbi:MAG: DUF3108 domain-containing protein [Pseudomonadota bacterium]